MITPRDLIILRHIETYGYITLKQATQIAYNSITYGYDYTRRRLNILIKQSNIKSCRSAILNCNIYYVDPKFKNPSLHKNLSLDYYCRLISMEAEIEHFQQEEKWLKDTPKECISDAVCIYVIGNARFHNFIEVNTSNNKLKLSRFENAVSEYQKRYNTNSTPTIILIDDAEHKEYNTKMNVIRLNYSLNNISEVLI